MTSPQLVEVSVEQGVLRGQRVTSQDGGLPYDAFRGVPYAQKPVGPLRFKAPRPPEGWEGARPALEEGPKAPQPDIFAGGNKLTGKEDCLYLNVYTPQVPSSVASRSPEFRAGAPWPIMVYIHPGAFTEGTGSAAMCGPELLVAKDVVVITLAYRLGALGFLSLGSSAAPGNNGLKDIIAALRWVKKNGGAFGGNVDQITIFGCSAGSAAVMLLQLSPASKGLFHRAIAQSGSSINPWVIDTRPRDHALRLARQLGATQNDLADDEKVMEFLRSQAPEAILEATAKLPTSEEYNSGMTHMFLPTVDGGLTLDDPEDEIVLPRHPRDLMNKQGRITDVPLIAGMDDVEGLLVDFPSPALIGIKAIPEVLARFDQNLESAMPPELREYFPDGSEKQKKVVDKIRQIYFNGEAISEATKNGYYHLQSDLMMNTGILQEARAYARTSSNPVYVYCFGFVGRINTLLSICGKTIENTPGACHADEMNYLWTTASPMPPLEPHSPEAQTRHRMVTLWTNFAKFGNPTPEGESTLDGVRWPALPNDVQSSIPYLHIGATLVPQTGLFEERVKLWDSLYSELK